MAVAYVTRYRKKGDSTTHASSFTRGPAVSPNDPLVVTARCGTTMRGVREDFGFGYSAYDQIVTCRRCLRILAVDRSGED